MPKALQMQCQEVVRRLWPLLDGALPERERSAVIAHLEDCDGCRSHRDFARSFLGAVRRASPSDAEFDALKKRVEGALVDAQPLH